MTGLYVSKLLALLGEIASAGRTGRLYLNKAQGDEAGALRFTGGVLAGFTPPASDTKPSDPTMDPVTALRHRITLATMQTSANHGAQPGFVSSPNTETLAAAASLNAADLAIDLCK